MRPEHLWNAANKSNVKPFPHELFPINMTFFRSIPTNICGDEVLLRSSAMRESVKTGNLWRWALMINTYVCVVRPV